MDQRKITLELLRSERELEKLGIDGEAGSGSDNEVMVGVPRVVLLKESPKKKKRKTKMTLRT